jgi:hypothetical protein
MMLAGGEGGSNGFGFNFFEWRGHPPRENRKQLSC